MAVDYTAVGVLIGDATHTLLSESHILTLSTVVGTATYPLAAASARAIAADFANSVTKKAGDVSINASDKFDHYMKLAENLDRQSALASLGGMSAYSGGISKSDKTTRESNTDRVVPSFTRSTFDAPGDDQDSELA